MKWHSKSYFAVRDAVLTSLEQGVYKTAGGSKVKCTCENIFTFIEGKKKEWKIGVRSNGTNVLSQYNLLLESGIPAMAKGDVALAAAMAASVAKEIRSKQRADLPPKTSTAQRDPVPPAEPKPVAPK